MDIQAAPIIEAFRTYRDPSKVFVLAVAVLNGRLIRWGVEVDAPPGADQDDLEASAKPRLDEWWSEKLESERLHEQGQCGGEAAYCITCMGIADAQKTGKVSGDLQS